MSNELKEIDFYEDKLTAIRGDDGRTYVGLRQLVENIGLSWGSQREKIMDNPLLRPEVRDIGTVGRDAKERVVLCLPADLIPGYILTLNLNKMTEDIKPKVLRYAKEAYKVLADVFMGPGFATHPDARRVDVEAMKARSEELAVERHKLVLASAKQMVEWEPNYSKATLSRMVELSVKANLQGELVQERRILDVGAFLVEKGLSSSEARKKAPAFGKALKVAFIRKHGKSPSQHRRFVDGAERMVFAYTEEDRDLMESIYE